jgi:hypothetical protein
MAFAIKTEIHDPRAKNFAFTAQKTMYGGKHVAEGDAIFVFASENEGGQGPSRVPSSRQSQQLRKSAASSGKRRGEPHCQTYRAREAAAGAQ